jgi:hypothetical protein
MDVEELTQIAAQPESDRGRLVRSAATSRHNADEGRWQSGSSSFISDKPVNHMNKVVKV